MFFQLFSTIKVSHVAKIMQSTYLCVTFHPKHKKIAISHGFNMNSNSWKNPRWRLLLVTSQANQQRHYP